MKKYLLNANDEFKVPDHDFLFAFAMFAITLSNDSIKEAAADWHKNGCAYMKPWFRGEALSFVQKVLGQACVHCGEALGTVRYPGME